MAQALAGRPSETRWLRYGRQADERDVLLDILDTDPALTAERAGQAVFADKDYYGREFAPTLIEAGLQTAAYAHTACRRSCSKGLQAYASVGLSVH